MVFCWMDQKSPAGLTDPKGDLSLSHNSDALEIVSVLGAAFLF